MSPTSHESQFSVYVVSIVTESHLYLDLELAESAKICTIKLKHGSEEKITKTFQSEGEL